MSEPPARPKVIDSALLAGRCLGIRSLLPGGRLSVDMGSAAYDPFRTVRRHLLAACTVVTVTLILIGILFLT